MQQTKTNQQQYDDNIIVYKEKINELQILLNDTILLKENDIINIHKTYEIEKEGMIQCTSQKYHDQIISLLTEKEQLQDTLYNAEQKVIEITTLQNNTNNNDVDNNNNGGGGDDGIDLKLCEAMILRKRFTQQQLFDCLQEYEELNLIQINRSRKNVYFL